VMGVFPDYFYENNQQSIITQNAAISVLVPSTAAATIVHRNLVPMVVVTITRSAFYLAIIVVVLCERLQRR